MATLSSISLRFVSLFALVVAFATGGSAFPSASSTGGGGFVSFSTSILDAYGGVTIGSVSFSGSFASFDGGEVPTNANGGFLFFSGYYLGEGESVGFPSVGLLVDERVLWPAFLVVAVVGWPLVVGGWLWMAVMAARVSSLLILVLGFFFWVCWSLVFLGLGPIFIFYFCFCYLSFMMDDGVSASSVV